MPPRFLALAALVSLPLACSDTDTPAPNRTPFLGTWGLSAGRLALNCGALGNMEPTLSGSIIVAAGQRSHLSMTFSTPELAACVLALDIAGGVANIRANQSCPFTYLTFAGTFTTRSGAMIPAAETATLTLAGTLNAALGNIAITCEGTLNGTLTRGALPDDGGTPDAGVQDAGALDATADERDSG